MGNEIKRDMCPEKYYAKGSVVKETFPTIIALIIFALFNGSLLNKSGINIILTIIIEIIVCCVIYVLIYFLFKGAKSRLAETYISVCENGVCGICGAKGYKNKNFDLLYSEIDKLVVKGERLFLYSKKGTVILTLKDAPGTSALIMSKNNKGKGDNKDAEM